MDKIAQKSLEKLPPYGLEAEQAVLGAVLLDDTALAAALTVFDPAEHALYRLVHHWTDPSAPVSAVFIDNDPSHDFKDGGRGKGLLVEGVFRIRGNGKNEI